MWINDNFLGGFKVPKSVKLNDDLLKRLSRIAKKEDRTPHYLMVKYITKGIEQAEKRKK